VGTRVLVTVSGQKEDDDGDEADADPNEEFDAKLDLGLDDGKENDIEAEPVPDVDSSSGTST